MDLCQVTVQGTAATSQPLSTPARGCHSAQHGSCDSLLDLAHPSLGQCLCRSPPAMAAPRIVLEADFRTQGQALAFQLPTLPSPKGKALQGCSGSCTEPLGGFKPPSHLCPSPVAPQVWSWCPWGRAVPGQLSVPPAPWGTPEPPEQPSPCQSHPPGQTTPGLWEPSLETGWGPCRTLRLGTAIPPGDEPPSERTEPGTAQGWHIIPPDPLPALGLATSPGSGQEMLRKGTEALEKP